jgi:uncharacterized damage-inducible protein DinB
MHLYGPNNLTESMRTVRKNTIQIAQDIPRESYDYRPTVESKSIAEILLHIAAVWQITYQIHQTERLSSLSGFDFNNFSKGSWVKEKETFDKHQLIQLLQREGQHFCDWVQGLPEAVLMETVQMPPGSEPASKTRFEMLLGAKEHEMHHRAQLMVIQRLLGIVPHLTRNRQAPIQTKAENAAAVPATTS